MDRIHLYAKVIKKVADKYKWEEGDDQQSGSIRFYKKSRIPKVFLSPRFSLFYHIIVELTVWDERDFDYVLGLARWIEKSLKKKVKVEKVY